jgi:PAS domain S-box-containing protein
LTSDPQALSLIELEAENARLKGLLEEAGLQTVDRIDALVENEIQHRNIIALSRAEATGYLRQVDKLQRDARHNLLAHDRAVAGLSSDLETSQNLVADLRATQLALKASEERLGFVFEAAGTIGWWDWDIANDRIYASPQFARMYGLDPAIAAAGAPLAAFVHGIHPDDRPWVEERIAAILAKGGEFAEEYRLLRGDGSITWVYARGRCYLDSQGRPLRYPGVAIDITERKQSETRKSALVELGDRLRDIHDIGQIALTAAEILSKVLRATRAGFGIVDQKRETVTIQPDWRMPGVRSLSGLHHFRSYGSFIDDLKRGDVVAIGDVTADERTRGSAGVLLDLGIRVLLNMPIIEQGRFVAVVFVHYDKPHDWTDAELDFVHTVADRTQAAVGRIRAEEQQRLLNRELSHRLKNNLAMVQAIVAQTMRKAPDLATAQASLNARLMSLGRAHDLLLSGDAGSADVKSLIEGVLTLHDDGQGRIGTSGPVLDINPSASLSLSLILHELATNAAKYGSLSVPEGHVEVRWTLEEHGGEDVFSFTWEEHGGPAVMPPKTRGFGSRLIERGLAGSIGGKVQLDYRPEGVICRLSAPMSWITSSDES